MIVDQEYFLKQTIFLYFTDITQLNYVRANNPDSLESMLPITGTMAVAFELERLKIDFIDEWDFLKPEDIETNKDIAHSLADEWSSDISKQAEIFGFSLDGIVKQDLIYAFEASLNARTIYNRIFTEYSVEQIWIYPLPEVAVIRTGPAPASRAVNSVTQAVIFYLAELNGIFIKKIITDRPVSFGRTKTFFNGLINTELRSVIGNYSQFNEVIIVYKTGIQDKEYVELIKVINKIPSLTLITVTQDSLESDIRQDIAPTIEAFWDRVLQESKIKYSDFKEIFANPYFAFQFERIKKEIISAYVYRDNFISIINVLRPSLVIFGHDAFTIERCLVKCLNERSIQTLGLVHSGLGFKYGYRGIVGDVSKVLVWNDIDLKWLKSLGIENKRLKKIGSIRYEERYLKRSIQASSEGRRNSKKRLNLDKEKAVISILTAEINTGLAAPVAVPSEHRNIIKEVLQLIKNRPDVNFIIKAHPGYDYYSLYRSFLNYGYPNLIFEERLTLENIVAASDICLMINYCTTAALEAMIHGVPIIFLENAVYDLPDWVDSLAGTKIPRVSTVYELEMTINKLLNDNDFLDAVLKEMNAQVIRLLGIAIQSSSDRLIEVIEQAISSSKECDKNFDYSVGQNALQMLIESKINLHGKNISKYSGTNYSEPLIFGLAYVCGAFKADISILFKIYKLFNTSRRDKDWHQYKWHLLQPYISGRLNNSDKNKSHYFLFKIFFIYLLSPKQFINSSFQFKKNLGKYIIGTYFPKMPSFIVVWAYKVKDKLL